VVAPVAAALARVAVVPAAAALVRAAVVPVALEVRARVAEGLVVLEVQVPEVQVPEVQVPEVQVLEVQVPEVQVLEAQVLEVQARAARVPAVVLVQVAPHPEPGLAVELRRRELAAQVPVPRVPAPQVPAPQVPVLQAPVPRVAAGLQLRRRVLAQPRQLPAQAPAPAAARERRARPVARRRVLRAAPWAMLVSDSGDAMP
jgi:hypothetical protein